MDDDISFWIDSLDQPWRGFNHGDEIDIVVDGETVARAKVTGIDADGGFSLVTIPKSGD